MRKQYTILNGISGLVNRIITIVFVFAVRHYFVKYLSAECLGLEGLFTNILGLFSLVDLGLGSAISFNLYEPIHNKDRALLSSIMKLYKILYISMGLLIFTLSLVVMPFITIFVKGYTLETNLIRLYFILYSLSVSVTYFFSYKRTLIFALQKNYIVTNVDTVTKIILSLLQIILISNYRNYSLYLIASIIINFLGNVVISLILNNSNQYDTGSSLPLPKEFKTKLVNDVKALSISNIAWQGISSTDNILISAFVGIIDLAKNANYSTICVSIINIVNSLLGGASASIGDLLTEKNKVKSSVYFDRYCFIYQIIAFYASLGLLYVSEPLISIWVGDELLFDFSIVLVISFSLVLKIAFKPLADFLNYSGYFTLYSKKSLIALVINVVSSMVLVLKIGIRGVFIGTILTYVYMFYSIVDILYDKLFEKDKKLFYKNAFVNFLPAILCFIIMFGISSFHSENLVIWIMQNTIEVSILYFAFSFIILRKNENFIYFTTLIKKMINRLFPTVNNGGFS